MLLNKLQENNKQLFMELELLLVNVDGDFSESEKELVQRHCKEMGIEPIEYDDEIKLDDLLQKINEGMTVKEKKIILIELITVALIDGVYDNKEKQFVDSLRKLLQIPEEVAEQAYGLVNKLVETSISVENFVEW